VDANEIDKNPPTTVREIGIHLVYISQKLVELDQTMKALPNGFASLKDLTELEARVVSLESRQNIKNTLLWVGLVASAIINVVVIYQLFGGGQ
jgi:hypothetical protein